MALGNPPKVDREGIPFELRGPKPMSPDDMEVILLRWPAMLQYDPHSGRLIWRQLMLNVDQRGIAWADRPFGPKVRIVDVDGFRLAAARVVWLLHHKEWPRGKLGYKDGDGQNTRIENLVELPENPVLRRRPKGVAKAKERWQAYGLDASGHRKHLGVFDTIEEAEQARKSWDEGWWSGAERKRKWPKGVARLKNEWQAYGYCADGQRKHLGVYPTMEAAQAAREAWDEGTWLSGRRVWRTWLNHIKGAWQAWGQNHFDGTVYLGKYAHKAEAEAACKAWYDDQAAREVARAAGVEDLV